jgi:hypothetical protein
MDQFYHKEKGMMKKHILSLLAMLVLLSLSACFPVEADLEETLKPESELEEPPESYYYTVPIRLVDDDTIGISVGGGGNGGGYGTSRALTNETAQAFHDFFEVVFLSGGVVARTTWNVGETPELRGVRGKRDGDTPVAYDYVSGSGSAVLFAGSKADKTLLALGRLTSADGDGPATTIANDTTEVTFTVAALRAGASFATANISPGPGGNPPNTSSFFTNFNGGGTPSATSTIVSQQTGAQSIFIHYVDKKRFPLYRLNHGTTTAASYTFYTASGTPFNTYALGFVRVGYHCEVRQPRYILADGYYQTSSIFPQAVSQGATNLAAMTNNILTTDTIFSNPVNFTFNTTNSPDGSIFALTFEIFVNNLTSDPTTTPGSMDTEPVRWRISTGIGTKWLDLDDGLGGEGGAILLGSGTGNILTDRLVPYNNW